MNAPDDMRFRHDEIVAYTRLCPDYAVRTYLGKVLYQTGRRVRIVFPIRGGRATEASQEMAVSPSNLRRATDTDRIRARANNGLIFERLPRRMAQSLAGERA